MPRNRLFEAADDQPPNRMMALGTAPTLADAWSVNGPAIAQNFRDAYAAAQDPSFWTEAARQWSQAMLAGSVAPGGAMKPWQIADRIGKYADLLGFNVGRDSSQMSGSSYLTLTHDALDGPLKIRVSDHDLPPSYGPPGDYDVHSGAARDFSTSWQDVVRQLAEKTGQKAPTAADLAAASKAAKLNSFDGQIALLKKAYPDFSMANMRDFAARYEADNPGKVPWTPHFNIQSGTR